jgi:glutaminase
MMRHELHAAIDDAYRRYQSLTSGQVATYIPELGLANPELFAIALATASGRLFEVGDTAHPFTVQSISKPLMFGLALERFGHDTVSRYVGVEPSGDTFNAISLQAETHRPHNAMINAGAITITALLHAQYGDETFDVMLERLSQAAGRQLSVDCAVYESERRTGHRNRAIAHLLLNFGMVHDQAEDALDIYFRQCAVLVTCRDLAIIGATLANIGRQPADRRGGLRHRQREKHAGHHVHLRHVRLLGRMGVSGRPARQERRERRRHGGGQPPTRDCDVLASS